MEGPRLTNEMTVNGERKQTLKTEFGSLRHDWFVSKGIEIEGKKYSEIKKAIQQFYAENSDTIKEVMETTEEGVDVELQNLSIRDLDYKRLAEVRKKLDLPKYVSLSEAVAFIKTAMDLNDEGITERYAEYCASGISLDDMRNTLAYENDVKPVRLDTDIYHQSPERTRSAVEIVSNAIDAMNQTGITIGRFGVGFYQILSHLKEEDDYVKVTTGNEQTGFYEISFKLVKNEIKFHLEEVEEPRQNGTTVELHVKDFPKDEAETLIKKHFAFNSGAKVNCNGVQVNRLDAFGVDQAGQNTAQVELTESGFIVTDSGIGMSPQVILEKLLVPKISGKKPVQEMMDLEISPTYMIERGGDKSFSDGKVVINVGGVVIEEVTLGGINVLKTLVIDLPPFTLLGEERNQVAVDEVTIKAVKKIIDKVVATGDIQLLNSLSSIVFSLQKRSQKYDKEHNIVSYLQDRAQEILPEGNSYLPNSPGFERVDIPNAVLIDPLIKQTNWNVIPEFELVETDGDGLVLITTPLAEKKDEPVVRWKNRILLSKEIYDKYKDDPTVLNVYLEAYGKGNDSSIKKIKEGAQKQKRDEKKVESKEKIDYKSFEDFSVRNWNLLGCDSPDTAKMWCQRMTTKQKETSENVFKYIVNSFPVNYAKYFVDAVFSNVESDRLTEENLSRIASLANDPKLPGLLADLGIEPIRSLDLQLNHLEGVAPEDPFGDYTDNRGRDDRPFRTRLYNDSEWLHFNYWDRANLINIDGTVFPGSFRSIGKNMMYCSFGGTGRVFNPQTRQFFEPTFETGRLPDKQINFDEKELLVYEYGEFTNDGPFYGQNNCKAFDLNTSEEYNPHPELGKIIRFDDYYNKDVPAGTPDRSFFVYKKGDDESAEYHLLFSDGSIKKLDSTDRSVVGKTIESEKYWYKSEVEGETLLLKIGDKTVYSEEFKGASNGDRYWHDRSSDDVVKRNVDLSTFNQGDQRFIMWRSRVKSKEIWQPIDIYGNHGGKDEWDKGRKVHTYKIKTAVISENGQVVFELGLGKAILNTTDNEYGEKRFLVGSYSDMTSYSPSMDYTDWPLLDDYYVIDINGNKMPKEDLKLFKDVRFIHHGETQFKENSNRQVLSLYPGDTWKYKFDFGKYEHKTKGQQPAHVIKIVDNETGIPIINRDFRSVYYNNNTGLWECIELDYIKDGEKFLNKIIYIDAKGNVIEEGVVGDKKKILSEGGDNYPSQLRLLEADFELSPTKAESVKKILESSIVEQSQQNRRFLNRVFKYAGLKDENFQAILPILLYFRDVEDHVLKDEIITEVEIRTKDFDESNKTWFYQFLIKTLNENFSKEESSLYIGKLHKVFKDKIAVLSEDEKKLLYDTFQNARTYGQEYIVNGWNIVKFKTPIPSQQIPEKIRPIIDFLRLDESTMFAESKEKIDFTLSSQFTLSQLIQAKRLNENQVQEFNGDITELEQLIKRKVEGKKQDHIQREIIHPIYYQSVNNPYLFIRELVQNAYDAVIQNGLKSEKDKSVAVDIFSRENESVTLRIEDHVGMSLGEILNYFLIPGETTKLGQKDTIGYFGQGLFTLFRGAKEAVIKTSKGDGVITKLKIIPKLDDKGMVSDLDLTVEQEEGDFKGTVIERTVSTEYPTVEGAYIKNATSTFTSLVDGNVIDIYMNGQRLNDKQNKLASIEVPGLGEMQIFDAPNNVVTQRGLFVKGLDADFDARMSDIESLLSHRGYVLNIPDSISLTRSRNEIAQKQEVLEKLREYLPTLKVKAYIEFFRQDIIKGHVIQLKDLPEDYFWWDYTPTKKQREDAEKVRKGEPLDDVTNYLERSSLITLLVLLPVVEINNVAYSLEELKEASLNNLPPLVFEKDYEQIPGIIKTKLIEGKKQYDRMLSERSSAKEQGKIVPDFSFEDWQKQPVFIREQIEKQFEEYRNMFDITNTFNEVVCRSFGDDRAIGTTFYSEPGSLAHATQGFGVIGWNLEHWKGWNIHMFREKNPPDHALRHFIDVWSHEFGHILEKRGFTHNPRFYRSQAEALSRLMYSKADDSVV